MSEAPKPVLRARPTVQLPTPADRERLQRAAGQETARTGSRVSLGRMVVRLLDRYYQDSQAANGSGQ